MELASTMITFTEVDPDEPEARRLRAAMEEEIDRLYADRGQSLQSANPAGDDLRAPHGTFLLALEDGTAVGCAGLKHLDERTCEIKRMYLDPGVRGRGLSRLLLAATEDLARARGYEIARLDTADRQPTAKRLYTSAGYREIPDYNGNTLARFWFEREL
jgi:GNAT superfamily N-acetyltransferase